jgi:hypothetical protein
MEYCWLSNKELCPGFTNRDPVPLPDFRPPVFVRWLVALMIVLLPVSAMLLRRRQAKVVQRIGGIAGIAGGAFWLFVLFSSEWVDDSPFSIFIIAPFLMALGAAGMATLWRRGLFGSFALWFSMFGAIILAEGVVVSDWFGRDEGWGMLMLGLLVHTTGLFLFGLVNLKRRVLSRWNALPLIVGLFGGPLPLAFIFLISDTSDIPVGVLLGVLGGGWVLLGGLILRSQKHKKRADLEP